MVTDSSASTKYHVCLICLRRFTTERNNVVAGENLVGIKTEPKTEPIEDDEGDDIFVPGVIAQVDPSLVPEDSDPASPALALVDTYSRFLRFADRYLKLTAVTDSLVYKETQLKEDRGPESVVETFCGECNVNVEYILDVYDEIQARQLCLLGKLDALGEAMKGSTKLVSLKLQWGLFKTLGQQLKVKSRGRVQTFRKMLEFKCKNQQKQSPQVTLQRGLLSDQGIFSYAATQQLLLRLIVVYALGTVNKNAPPSNRKSSQTTNIIKGKNRKSERRCKRNQENCVTTEDPVDFRLSATVENGKSFVDSDIDIEAEENDEFTQLCTMGVPQHKEEGGETDPNWSFQDEPVSDSETTSTIKQPKRRKSVCSKSENLEGLKSLTKRRRQRRPGKTLLCPKCPVETEKSFKGYAGLQKHLKLVHQEEIDYPCLEVGCGMLVKNAKEMVRHKQKFHHGGQNGGPHLTHLEIFPSEGELRSHKRTHLIHSEETESKDKVKVEKCKSFRGKRRPYQSGPKMPPAAKELDRKRWSQCEICGSDEKTEYFLRKHLESVHERPETQPLTCYFCNKRFTVRQTVYLHVFAVHSKEQTRFPFDCDYAECDDIAFRTWEELHEHLKDHVKNSKQHKGTSKKVREDDCTSEQKTDLKIHYCSVCGWGCVTEDLIDVHQTVHTEKVDGMYPCSKCSASFDFLPILTKHYSMVHGRHMLRYKCEVCDHKSFSKRSLKMHMRNRHEVDEFSQTIPCEELDCGQTFSTASKLTLHLMKDHKKGTSFQCEECGKKFYWPSLLKIHMRSHRAPMFECNICKAKFKRRLTLERHKSRDHMEEEEGSGHLKCTQPDCDKMFVTRSLLTRHLIRVHGTGPGQMCQECGSFFVLKSDLKNHMRSHQEAKWKCDICHKMFKRSITLRYHKETIHNPNRVLEEFVCTECGAVFNSSSGLKFHQNSKHVPESERRYACPNCPRRYHRGALLHLHLKKCKEKTEGNSSHQILPMLSAQPRPSNKTNTKKSVRKEKTQ